MRKLIPSLLLAAFALIPATAAGNMAFPDRIDLPDGFRPEGIAVGGGNTFYAGSLADGSVYRGDLRTGNGMLVVPPQDGRIAVGLSVDNNEQIFVAGGPSGQGYVYDGRTGSEIEVLDFTTGPTFVNDVIATREAAYFTDSFQPFLYRVPIAGDGTIGVPEAIPLSGDYVQGEGFNVNGIDATPDGDTLVIVQSATGKLFTVDPATGVADEIDLGGGAVPNGDGIVLEGKVLYVVQNRLNQVARVDLSPDLSAGEIVATATHPDFEIPTTAARFGASLYAVNARFGTPDPGTAEYWITRIDTP